MVGGGYSVFTDELCLIYPRNALGILSIPGREGGGRSDESEERPRAFSSLVVTYSR